MSNARKCDRCGKYSDVSRAGEIAFKDDIGSFKWDKCMDLCEDCLGKLKRWLTNEAEK